MARVKGALATRKRRKKILKLAKGYWGAKSKHFKMAKLVTWLGAHFGKQVTARPHQYSTYSK